MNTQSQGFHLHLTMQPSTWRGWPCHPFNSYMGPAPFIAAAGFVLLVFYSAVLPTLHCCCQCLEAAHFTSLELWPWWYTLKFCTGVSAANIPGRPLCSTFPFPWHPQNHSCLERWGVAKTVGNYGESGNCPAYESPMVSWYPQVQRWQHGTHGLLMVTAYYWQSQANQWAIKWQSLQKNP